MFANQAAFDQDSSYRTALGQNLTPGNAVTDPNGQVLFYMQTGGMIEPKKVELDVGTVLHRFAAASGGVERAMRGGWWIARAEFDRIVRFGQIHGISDPMAARILCGVPPEWSDMGSMIRVRVRTALLAWRGLANSVMVPHPTGGPLVTMLHQNALAERRLHQLFIPGLGGIQGPALPFSFEGEWRFSGEEAMRGWIYV